MKNICGKDLGEAISCGTKFQGQEGDACVRCDACKAIYDAEAKANWLKEKRRLKNRKRRGK